MFQVGDIAFTRIKLGRPYNRKSTRDDTLYASKMYTQKNRYAHQRRCAHQLKFNVSESGVGSSCCKVFNVSAAMRSDMLLMISSCAAGRVRLFIRITLNLYH